MARPPALAPQYNASPPPLVDSQGVPLQRERLKEEISAASMMTARSILGGHPADGLTPQRLAALLLGAEGGDPMAYLELAEQIEEKDAHYLSVLGTRKRQVSQLPISIVAASTSAEDERNAALVRDWVERDEIESDLFDILDAIGKGFSISEIIWTTDVKRWFPDRIERRDPRWFLFDHVDGTSPQLRGEGAPVPLTDFPFKFIYHKHVAKSGLPIRGGLARPAAWLYLFKSFGLKDWMTFAEIYGMPFRIGKYTPGATEADIRTLMRAVANLGSDAAAVIASTMEIELVDGKANGNADLYLKLLEYIDMQFSKMVLGQTATTDSQGGGLGGSGKEHNDVRGDIERADAKLISATLNRQLVRPMVDLNYGRPVKYPLIRIGREEATDLRHLGEFLAVAVPLGMRVGEKEVRDRAGLAEPAEGERVLMAPAALPPPAVPALPAPAHGSPESAAAAAGGGSGAEIGATGFSSLLELIPEANRPAIAAAFAALAATPAQKASAIEGYTARELGDWEAIVAPMLAPVDQLIAGAASLEEVRERLAGALAEMDTTRLHQLLERGGFMARLAGAAGDA